MALCSRRASRTSFSCTASGSLAACTYMLNVVVLFQLSSGSLALLKLGLKVHVLRHSCLVKTVHDRVVALVHVHTLDLALFVEDDRADIQRAARLRVSIARASLCVL